VTRGSVDRSSRWNAAYIESMRGAVDVGTVVGMPTGARRRRTRAKGERIILGIDARGPLELVRVLVGRDMM
jgi:hypothetical protein